MTDKVTDLFPESALPSGGTFSNVVDQKPITMESLRDAVAQVRRLQMHAVGATPLILPPDWETRFAPSVVAEIRRIIGS